jgi:hypothetical protein
MDNARFEELSDELLSLEFAKLNPRKFALLLGKVIDTAVEYGVPEHNLHLMVSNAVDNAPARRTTHTDARRSHIPRALSVMGKLRGKSFNIIWGPDHGREVGYFVSLPNYKGGAVVPVSEVEAILGEV